MGYWFSSSSTDRDDAGSADVVRTACEARFVFRDTGENNSSRFALNAAEPSALYQP